MPSIPVETQHQLLQRIAEAIASRPVPPLVRTYTYADEFDWGYTVRAVGGLWNDGPAPPITTDSAWGDMIWLTTEQFRFGFLRLIESALRHPESDLESEAMWIAAEPVPRDAVAPPSRFCEFAPSEIRLVADSMQEFHRQFKSQLKPEDALFSGIRVADRAARNWQRFAAHVGAQTACPDD